MEIALDAEFFAEHFKNCRGWVNLWNKNGQFWRFLLDKHDWPQLTDNVDWYFGTCTRREQLDRNRRGGAGDILEVPAIWADIDFAEDAKDKKSGKKYPPKEVAIDLLTSMQPAPSGMVWSGAGVHPYWWLEEPITDLEKGAKAIATWQSLLAQFLEPYVLDSTHDLARVLRIPGTINQRCGQRAWFEIISGERYSLDIFDPVHRNGGSAESPEKKARTSSAIPVGVAESATAAVAFSAIATASPPYEKLEALLDNSPEFSRVWHHRREMPSCSEYELSLANHAVRADWSDQEIVELLICHRRKYDPDKLGKVCNRTDYLSRTIAKARDDVDWERSTRTATGSPRESADVDADIDGEPAAETRAGKLSRVSRIVGLEVVRFTASGDESPIYTLYLADSSTLTIASTSKLLDNYRALRDVAAEKLGKVMNPLGKKAWATVCQALFEIREYESMEETTTNSRIINVIDHYITKKGCLTCPDDLLSRSVGHPHRELDDQITHCIERGKTFHDSRFIYLSFNRLHRFVTEVCREKISPQKLGKALRDNGWRPKRVRVNGPLGSDRKVLFAHSRPTEIVEDKEVTT